MLLHKKARKPTKRKKGSARKDFFSFSQNPIDKSPQKRYDMHRKEKTFAPIGFLLVQTRRAPL